MMEITKTSVDIIKKVIGDSLNQVAEEAIGDGETLEWLSVYIWQQGSHYINNLYSSNRNCDMIKAFNNCFSNNREKIKLYRGITIEAPEDNISIDTIKRIALPDNKKYYSFSSSLSIATRFMSEYRPYNTYRVMITIEVDRTLDVSKYRTLGEDEHIVDISDIDDIKIEELYYVRNIIQ